MNRWHWEWCPTCSMTGKLYDRVCDVCDGIGRVKIPTGFHLAQDTTYRVTSGSNTTISSHQSDADAAEGRE